MIKFNVNKLRVETYYVKSLTTALGGAIRILDEELSTDEQEVYHRLPVPLAVVRQFKTKHKTMNYISPCLVAVTYYGDRAIALERHPAGCMGERWERDSNDVLKEWIPASRYNINSMIRPLVSATPVWIKEKQIYMERPKVDWYFDGRYLFTFAKMTAEEAVSKGTFLTEDGRFRCVNVDAIGLHKIDDRDKVDASERTCLVYVAKNGAYAVSPPIWKDATAVGQAKIKGSHEERKGKETKRDFNFDRVDEFCAVNLSFALKAAASLSDEFGFEAIEPLNLPTLMVRLSTVNLPKVPSEVKDTFDSGMKFTHALAWLLGFSRRCKSLDTYATIRSLLKYLTTNGLYFKQVFDPKNIFKDDHDLNSIPRLSKKEALEGEQILTLEERLDIIRNQRDARHSTGNVVAGTLYDDED